MLTRPSAEGAAAAAAAVVASAASVAFEAAQAWTVGGARGGVFLRSTHARARPALVPFLRALKSVGGNERLDRVLRSSFPVPNGGHLLLSLFLSDWSVEVRNPDLCVRATRRMFRFPRPFPGN